MALALEGERTAAAQTHKLWREGAQEKLPGEDAANAYKPGITLAALSSDLGARPCLLDNASRTQFLPACFATYKPASAAFTSSSRVLP